MAKLIGISILVKGRWIGGRSIRSYLYVLLLLWPSAVMAQFTEITTSAGVGIFGDPTGVGSADYDGDGFVDFMLPLGLYRNNGDETFTNVASSVGIDKFPNVTAWGDFDNDGDPDLATLMYGPSPASPPNGVHILRNDPGGGIGGRTFTVFTSFPETAAYNFPSWIDYDLDGDLDLYVGYFSGFSSRLFHNQLKETGSVSFTDVTAAVGLAGLTIEPQCISWGDVDNDGDPDFYLSLHSSFTDRFYKNELKETGSAFFTEILSSTNIAGNTTEFVLFLDFDNDGDLDLYQGLGFFTPNRLYRSLWVETGTLTFENVTAAMGVSNPVDGGPVAWGDIDNDGDVDLLGGSFSNDSWVLYRNELIETGSTGFTDVTTPAGLGSLPHQHMMHFFDINNDGDLDLFVPGNATTNRLFRNDYPSKNWLQVQLRGSRSSREGNGARVRVVTGGNTQIRDVQRFATIRGQGPGQIHFGLGAATEVDELTVFWPSGIEQTFTGIAANQIVLVNENQPPVADAGPDITTECASPSGTPITLNGSGSFDPDNDPLTFSWSAPGITFDDPSSATPTARFPLGMTTVTLTVEDPSKEKDSDEALVTVKDTTPPEVTATWEPIKVEEDEGTFRVVCTTEDLCDPAPPVEACLRIDLTGLEVKAKVVPRKGISVEIDQEEGVAMVKAPTSTLLSELLAALQQGCFPILDGQIVHVEVDDDDEGVELKFGKDGALRFEGATPPQLVCTATDASGNVGEATAVPAFASEEEDNDDEEEGDDDGGAGKLVVAGPAPASAGLFQNAPNPFNPRTNIAYQLAEAGEVSLVIYNLMGQPIRVLVHGYQEAGYYRVTWEGKDGAGQPVSSGIYLYRLVSKKGVQTQRMLLLR
jgi:hypothetical protein